MKTIIIFLMLIVAAFFLFEARQAWLGYACIAAAIVFAIAIMLKKIFSGTKKTVKALGKGISTEVEKAEGQYPNPGIWEEGLKEMGDKAGKQLFAPGDNPVRRGVSETYRWKFKGASGAASGTKKFMDAFKKLFGM